MRSGNQIFAYIVFQRDEQDNLIELLQDIKQFMNVAITGRFSINDWHQSINCFCGRNKFQNCTGKSEILRNELCWLIKQLSLCSSQVLNWINLCVCYSSGTGNGELESE